MKIKQIILILFLISLLGVGSGFASAPKLGTAGAVELLIPMGAQNVGMGGANIANIGGYEAIYWNPAGLSRTKNVEVGFNYMSYFADMNVSYLAMGAQVGALGALGFSMQSLSIGDIPVTTMTNPEGTGETLRPTFLTLNATYSRRFTDRIHFGLNAKLVTERIGDMQASAMAMDFGLQYSSPFGIDVGVVMRNYGSKLRFEGTSIEFDSDIPFANPGATTRKTKLDMASHDLPASLNMGAAYNYEINEMNGLRIAAQFSNNSYSLDSYKVGVEYNLDQMFFLRGGYNLTAYPDDYPEAAKEDQFGFTFGAGFHLLLNGRNLMFDYAYRDMDLFDANQYVSISLGF